MKKNLNNSKLIAYTAAAGAALAIAPNAFADIQHNSDANINFGQGNGGMQGLIMDGSNPEVSFVGTSTGVNSFIWCMQSIIDNFSVCNGADFCVKALSAGNDIDATANTPDATFGYFFKYTSASPPPIGDWAQNNQTNYFGVSFNKESDSEKVFGWIQLVRLSGGSGKVIAYGYEDDGTGIKAGAVPEPVAGLALLALGAAGIARYKRKRF